MMRYINNRQAAGLESVMPTPPRHAGFTLAEVMVAMGVFALGFVAVASLLPSAAYMQLRTIEAVQGKNVGENAEQYLMGMNYSVSDLQAIASTNNQRVQEWPTTGNNAISLNDRTYPSHLSTVANRPYRWVPLIKRESNSPETKADFTIYVFVLKDDNPDDGSTPSIVSGTINSVDIEDGKRKVLSLNGTLLNDLWPGDRILTANGNIYSIESIDRTNNKARTLNEVLAEDVAGVNFWYGKGGVTGRPTTMNITVMDRVSP